MTTEKEMLELAAKAMGIKLLRDPVGLLRNCTGFDPAMNIYAAPVWNPLTTPSDALGLAVKLNMVVWVYEPNSGATITAAGNIHPGWHGFAPHNGNALAATCLAIVQAAAKYAKEMP